MTMTDPVADMLTRIRNASRSYHESVAAPGSKVKKEIARILKEEGYVKDYKVAREGGHEVLRVELKYGRDRERAIRGIRRISKPGLRVYVNKDEIPRVLGGLGVAVVSTSKGLMTDRQAKKAGLGGEVVCYVW